MCAKPLSEWQRNRWNILSRSDTCFQCNHTFSAGDHFISGLANPNEIPVSIPDNLIPSSDPEEDREESEDESNLPDFVRLDFCPDCHEDFEPTLFSFWEMHLPEEDEEEDEGIEPDRSTLLGLWKGFREKSSSSEQEPEGAEQKIQYLLTLMLLRKNVLHLEEERDRDGTHYLVIRVRGQEERKRHPIPEPSIDMENIDSLTAELKQILQVEEETEDIEPEGTPEYG